MDFFHFSKHNLNHFDVRFVDPFISSYRSFCNRDTNAINPALENLSVAVCLSVRPPLKVSLSLSKVLPLPSAPFVLLLPLHTLCEVELMFDCGRLVDGKCSHSLCMTSMLLLISRSQPSRGNDFVHYVCLMKLSHKWM